MDVAAVKRFPFWTTACYILAMTDEEIVAEIRKGGEDPAKVAAHVRAIFERAATRYRN